MTPMGLQIMGFVVVKNPLLHVLKKIAMSQMIVNYYKMLRSMMPYNFIRDRLKPMICQKKDLYGKDT